MRVAVSYKSWYKNPWKNPIKLEVSYKSWHKIPSKWKFLIKMSEDFWGKLLKMGEKNKSSHVHRIFQLTNDSVLQPSTGSPGSRGAASPGEPRQRTAPGLRPRKWRSWENHRVETYFLDRVSCLGIMICFSIWVYMIYIYIYIHLNMYIYIYYIYKYDIYSYMSAGE